MYIDIHIHTCTYLHTHGGERRAPLMPHEWQTVLWGLRVLELKETITQVNTSWLERPKDVGGVAVLSALEEGKVTFPEDRGRRWILTRTPASSQNQNKPLSSGSQISPSPQRAVPQLWINHYWCRICLMPTFPPSPPSGESRDPCQGGSLLHPRIRHCVPHMA